MLPVTSQAPTHLEIGRTADPVHRGHLAVTGAAVNLGADMHHMREINMIWKTIDPDPWNRFAFVPVEHQLHDLRFVRRDELVAGPAVGHRRDAGDRRFCGVSVTIETLDAVITGMLFMAEGDRLDRRAIHQIQRQNVHQCQNGNNSAYQGDQAANTP